MQTLQPSQATAETSSSSSLPYRLPMDSAVTQSLKGIAIILFGLSLSLLDSALGYPWPVIGAMVALIGMLVTLEAAGHGNDREKNHARTKTIRS